MTFLQTIDTRNSYQSETMHVRFSFLAILLILLTTVYPTESIAQNRRVARADQAFELRQYSEALGLYRRAYNRVRNKDRREANRVLYQTALCYRYLNNPRLAETYFRRVVRANYPEPLAVLYLAETLMQNGKFEDAATFFARYAELAPESWHGPRGMEAASLAPKLLANPNLYQVEQARIFNSREDDMTPAFADHRASSLVFASSREDAVGKDKDRWTGFSHTSFFISYLDRAGNWSRPVLLDEGPVNTSVNEGAPSLNASATRMYFTRCQRSPDRDLGCRIFVSSRQGANWGEPQEVVLVADSALTVGHPAISPDELELFFVSDKPEGQGRLDIWVSRRRAPGDSFGPPENLGAVINTPGNEMFPYVHEDGSLYFASDGHPGLGGLDLFVSRRGPEGFSQPVNLGVPLNSTADDFGIVFYPGREQGFFTSNRQGSRGYDLYSFYLAPLEFTISGVVRSAADRRPLAGASIQLIGSDGSLLQAESGNDGRYNFGKAQVNESVFYNLVASRERYFASRGEISTRGAESSMDFTLDFELEPIPQAPIALPEILYDFASWELLPQFRDSLNGLVRTMVDNPNIVIELASHTDSRGTDEVNDTLSQRRAQSVVE